MANSTIVNATTFTVAPVMSGANITSASIPIVSIVGTAMDLTTDQTTAGIKTFSSPPVLSGASITSGTIPIASVVGTAMDLTTAQTVAGIKTFSSAPVMSGASITSATIPIASVVGTAMDLTTAQTAAGVKTFSSAPVLSGASITSGTIPIASVVGTAVALSGTQTITAVKTFTPQQIFTNSVQIPLGATNGYVLGSDASGNAAWRPQGGGGGDAILAATQSFTGVNTFTQPPVMSGASITAGTVPATSIAALIPNITYTGTFSTAIPFIVTPASLPNISAVVSGPYINVILNTAGEPNLLTFNYGNAQAGSFAWSVNPLGSWPITSISGANIIYMQNITITVANLTTFSLPNLVSVGAGGFTLTANALTTFSFPSLVSSGFTFVISCNSVTTYSVANLAFVASGVTITLPALTSFSMPALSYVGANFIPTIAAATSATMTSLATVVGAFTWSSAVLTTLSLPALVSVGSTFAITAANLVTFSMGSTLKLIGGNFTMSGMKLDAASVNGILVSLAALDGTSGTTAYSSKTVLLNGGTSAAPSGAGVTAKATLVSRGCTVTTN